MALSQVLGEAAEAAEALTDIVGALAALIAEGADRGSDILHWTTARELAKKAHFVPDRSTDLWCAWPGAAARPRVTLADYVAAPERIEWSWTLFELIASALADELDGMAAELTRQRTKFATTPELAELTVRLAHWRCALAPLRELDPPAASDDWTAVRGFLVRYVALTDRLREFGAAVAAYVGRLKADEKWPIRGK